MSVCILYRTCVLRSLCLCRMCCKSTCACRCMALPRGRATTVPLLQKNRSLLLFTLIVRYSLFLRAGALYECGSRENAATRVADYVDRAEMCKYHSDFYRRVYKTVSFSIELPACVDSVSRLHAAGPIS